MENSENIHEIPAKKPRKPYTRKPIAAIPEKLMTPPPPQVPNPNILAMESKIFELVELRYQAQSSVSNAEQVFFQAQAGLKRAQEQFSRIEQEIQYRANLANQMRGGNSGPGLAQNAPPMQTQSASWGYFPDTSSPAVRFDLPSQPMSPPYAPAQGYPAYPPAFDPRQVPAQGVGSAPGFPVDPITGRYSPYPDAGERIGDAGALRQDDNMVARATNLQETLRTRGY